MSSRPIQIVAVIGATGNLGVPVVTELARTFKVRAMVRSVDKAREILPSNVEIVKGDLQDITSLHRALSGVDAIYINLSTEATNLNLPYYNEREGIKDILKTIKSKKIQYIGIIGSLGAYPPAAETYKSNIVPNIIRMQGYKLIARSGIRHTIFAPTCFMDTLPMMIDRRNLQWIGNTNVKFYWISASDYAKQVVKAFEHPEDTAQYYPIQGPEAVSVKDALKTFRKHYDPSLNVRVVPLWLIKIIGLFCPKMKFAAHLFGYLGNHEDPFYAEETWRDLGRPTTTLIEYSQNLKNALYSLSCTTILGEGPAHPTSAMRKFTRALSTQRVTSTQLLNQALKLVPEHGWENAITETLRANHMSDQGSSLFAKTDLIGHYYSEQLAALQQIELHSSDKFGKLNELVKSRLASNIALGSQRLREAGDIAAKHPTQPAKWLTSLADELWFLAGDRSNDLQWYTRRGSLVGVYAALELFQMRDQSANMRDTMTLADKFVGQLALADYAKQSVLEWVQFNTRAAFNVARTFR